jgi:hypothetical protein
MSRGCRIKFARMQPAVGSRSRMGPIPAPASHLWAPDGAQPVHIGAAPLQWAKQRAQVVPAPLALQAQSTLWPLGLHHRVATYSLG